MPSAGEIKRLQDILVQRSDGHKIPVNISASRIELNGKALIMGVFRDIAERKDKEALLTRRQLQLAALAEAGRRINRHLNEDEIRRTLVNAARTLVDCKSGAAALYQNGTMCFHEYLYGDEMIPIEMDFPSGYGVPGHVLETRQPYISSDATKDKHAIPEIYQRLGFVKLIDVPILDAEGELLGCLEMHDRLDGADFDDQDLEMLESLAVVVADAMENARLIADLKRAGKVLQESEARFRKLVNVMPDAIDQTNESIMLTNKDGAIEYVNRAFTRITGYSAEEAIDNTPRILKSGVQDTAYYEEMWDAISSGRIWKDKVIDRRKDGSLYPVMLTISPIMDEQGDITHYIGVHDDITEIEKLQTNFHQAQKMEAIGTLAGGIAHDFNNMLAGMPGTIYLVREALEDKPDVQKKLKRVEKTGFRAAGMISQLLTFARKGQTHMQAMQLTPFVKEVFKLARSSVPENIRITLNVPETECTVKGDATLLQQVFLNLVNNAKHAVAGQESPEIQVSLDLPETYDDLWKRYPDLLNHSCVRLTVRDNGIGIA